MQKRQRSSIKFSEGIICERIGSKRRILAFDTKFNVKEQDEKKQKGDLLTPDGTKFAKSKEEMNVGFKEACNSIMKVKDVLTQIFG